MKLSEKKNFLLAFNGDSITDGGRGRSMNCNHIMGHGYPEMAAAEIGRRFLAQTPRFYNKGVGGQGIFPMAERWEDEIIRLAPDLVTVLIGINDAWNYKTAEQKAAWNQTYRKILTETAEKLPDTKIVLMDPFIFDLLPDGAYFNDVPHPVIEEPVSVRYENNTPEINDDWHTTVREMQGVVADLAREFGTLHIRSEEVLRQAEGLVPTRYLVWDGVHPTIVGHRMLADAWLAATAELF